MIFGDSFGWNVVAFLALCFRRLVFVHSTSPDRAIILEERPELVVTECTERFLVTGPSRLDRFRLDEVVRLKLSRLSQDALASAQQLYARKWQEGREPYYAAMFLRAVGLDPATLTVTTDA